MPTLPTRVGIASIDHLRTPAASICCTSTILGGRMPGAYG
jgi:hypothetical protein